jgi:hypothetical protein
MVTAINECTYAIHVEMAISRGRLLRERRFEDQLPVIGLD